MAKIEIEDTADVMTDPEENLTEETKEQAVEAEETGEMPEETPEAADETAEEEAGEPDEEAGDEPVEEENGTELETAGEPEETGSSRIKGLFKKKKDKKDQQIEELTDRVRRQMAEFDNFRKRTEKEKAAMYEIGAKSVIEKILPVVDNFERGLAGQSEESDPFTEGMFKIYRQMISTLEAMDVKPIEAVGQPFDPELHNAVMHVDDESVGENVIVEELQKGYKYRDSVVRYSMVKVAN